MRKLLKLLRYKRHIVDPFLLTTLFFVGCASLVYITILDFSNFWYSFHLMFVFGFAIIAGNHRLFSHNSWPAPAWFKRYISLLATLALHGPVIAWVAVHRQHHHKSDSEDDPHSPIYKGRMWVQFLSYNYTPDLRYALDLYKDKWLRMLFDYYWVINLAFGALLFVLDPIFLAVWLGGSFLAQMNAFAVNSLAHNSPWWIFPTKETFSGDASRNVPLLALIDGGEGWHLNHHRRPWRWYFGEKWWQFDLTGVQIFVTLLIINPAYLLEIYRKRKHNVITN
jgi:fatty-acid desaturase